MNLDKFSKRPYIYGVHTGLGVVLKFATCFWILLLLNNRSIVYFCGCEVSRGVTNVRSLIKLANVKMINGF